MLVVPNANGVILLWLYDNNNNIINDNIDM